MKLKEKIQRFWTLSKSHKGFTLVELIVVIAILAILAGVAIPVYNGYIKKAQEASDQQLLDTINTAFAAACLVNGIDQGAVGNLTVNEDGTIIKNKGGTGAASYSPDQHYYFDDITYDGATKGQDTLEWAAFDSTFGAFYAGNEAAAFKGEEFVGKTLEIDGETEDEDGAASTGAYASILEKLKGTEYEAYISALNSSIFMDKNKGLGIDNTLGMVDKVTDAANGLASGTMNEIYSDAAFQGYMMELLGGQGAAMEWLKENNYVDATGAVTDPDAYAKIQANAAVLYAAKNSSNMDYNSVKNMLSGTEVHTSILAKMDSDPAAGLADAAAAYAMYTAYAHATGNSALLENNDLATIMTSSTNGINNADFQNWVANSGKADADGYFAALEMINGCTSDTAAVQDILLNNYSNNGDLSAMLNQLLGSN